MYNPRKYFERKFLPYKGEYIYTVRSHRNGAIFSEDEVKYYSEKYNYRTAKFVILSSVIGAAIVVTPTILLEYDVSNSYFYPFIFLAMIASFLYTGAVVRELKAAYNGRDKISGPEIDNLIKDKFSKKWPWYRVLFIFMIGSFIIYVTILDRSYSIDWWFWSALGFLTLARSIRVAFVRLQLH